MPEENGNAFAADSILQIAKDNNLSQLVLVEDSMIGFIEAHKACSKLNIQLIFGLRLNCCNDVNEEDKDKSKHKIIIFAKNDNGCRLLNKIYSHAFCNNASFVDCKYLASIWREDELRLAIPFYDSFIYNNNFLFSTCIPNFHFSKPTYFIERNNLPFDEPLELLVQSFSSETVLSKSIFYNLKKDVFSFQTYKCITNRAFGKEQSLSSPNLNHFGSDEFCWESFKENERLITI